MRKWSTKLALLLAVASPTHVQANPPQGQCDANLEELYRYQPEVLGHGGVRAVKDSLSRSHFFNAVAEAIEANQLVFTKRGSGKWERINNVYVKDGQIVANVTGGKKPLATSNTVVLRTPNGPADTGTLVRVQRSDKLFDVGEVIKIENGIVTVRVGARDNGSRGTREYKVRDLLEQVLNASNEFNGSHIKVNRITSMPNGLRFPSRSRLGNTIVVDRRYDTALRRFLMDGIPRVKAPVNGRKPTQVEMAERAYDIVRETITYATEGNRSIDKGIDQYYKDRSLAKKKGRANFAGDVVLYGRGVCKDFGMLATILLHDCGVNARYIRGSVPGGGHVWVEFYDASGKLWIMDPTQRRRPTPSTEYKDPQSPWLLYEKIDLEVQFPRF